MDALDGTGDLPSQGRPLDDLDGPARSAATDRFRAGRRGHDAAGAIATDDAGRGRQEIVSSGAFPSFRSADATADAGTARPSGRGGQPGTRARRIAAAAEPVVGKWAWFTGQTVTIRAGGNFVDEWNNEGTWARMGPAGRAYILRWRHSDYVDTLTLSQDLNALAGANQTSYPVDAERIED